MQGQLYLGVMEEKRGTGGGGGGALQKGFWGMETSSIGQTIWGGGSEGQVNIPFQCVFLFLPVLLCKQEKENKKKKNKQINKNMGGAVLRPHPDRSQPSCTEIKTGNLALRSTCAPETMLAA